MKKALILGLLAGWLALAAGCSALPDKTYPPAKLPKHSKEAKLISLWQDSSGTGELNRGYELPPALEANLLVAGDAEGLVQAFNLDTANWFSTRLEWQVQLEAGLSAGISLSSNQAFIATQNGKLFALNKATGKINWQAQLASEVLASPQIHDNLLVVITSNGQISAFNATTGNKRWTHVSLMPNLSLRGSSTPLVTNLLTFVGLTNGKLIALDNASGQPRWEARLAQPQGRTDIERLVDVRGQPQQAGGYLLANSFQGQTQALDPFSGRSSWHKNISSYQGLTLYQNQVIVIDEASRIHSLNLSNGATNWVQDKLYGRELTQAVVLENTLVVADYQGYLHLINPEKGTLIGRKSFDQDGISATPQVNNNRLLVHSNRGRLGLFTLKPKD